MSQPDFSELTRMIQAQMDEIEKRIEELDELRKIRTRLQTMLRAADPTLAPSKPKATKSKAPASEEKMESLTRWLQERAATLNENGGFSIATLEEYADELAQFGQMVTVAKMLPVLHERGVLHLDRYVQGRPTAGRPVGKFYKVVA
jgi:hypothetical protein